MLKSIVMMDLPIDDIAPMERWYYEAHSSEISRIASEATSSSHIGRRVSSTTTS